MSPVSLLTSNIEPMVRVGGPLHPVLRGSKRVLQNTIGVECLCVCGRKDREERR